MSDGGKPAYKKGKYPAKRARATQKLSSIVHQWVTPAFRRRGFVEHRIITHWPEIIGQNMVQYCIPKRVRFYSPEKVDGTLTIEVFNSGLAMELQHMEPVIVEKISTYFGYNVISHIKIIQNIKRLPHQQEASLFPTKPRMSKAKQKALDEQLKHIDDPKLKERLRSLGMAMESRKVEK